MKANELRIRNWVNVTDKDYQVTQILERGVNCGHIGAIYDLVKPIPLTEDWLTRFGFEKNENGEPQIDACEGTALSISIGETPYKYSAWLCVKGNFQYWQMSTCEFVHELQNFYFALTGEELELKETK